MDTDYLTPMAYDCITLAYDAIDVLRSELGAACMHFDDEDAYVKEIEEDPEDYLDDWNLLEETDLTRFRQKIQVLRQHVEKTIATPHRRTR